MGETRTAIIAAVTGNAIIAAAKLTAGAISGSSAMIADGIHSLVDAGNGSLLLVGRTLAKRPPDPAW